MTEKPVFLPELRTTGIGSLPFADAQEAVEFVFDCDFSIPFWPQLPQHSFREFMIPQYSEGMPCARLDDSEKTLFCDTGNKAAELEVFYEKYLSEYIGHFPISEEFAAGLYLFEKAAGERKWDAVKVHTTGPLTFTQGIKDDRGEPVYNDPDLRDASVKLLARKTQWQLERFRKFSERIMIAFIDEPVLSAYGSSSYVGISESDVHNILREPFDAIEAAGALSAVHVCGNSDWGMVLRSGVDIVNFDAFEFGHTISLYADDLSEFLGRGGCIAWGIVPTSEAVRSETRESLAKRLGDSFTLLRQKGFQESLLMERSLLTPSCGAGSLSIDDTKRVFDLLFELREKLA